ncbi:hypothetical protein H257_10505 [Aphanomyces astaci]|uniref:Uncharacterized protein n=1 Tax=Aphanomyces astaci TaxID=112090 RepID=W4G7Q5_APHAT|nr:hypothetical protein H257_10505 [Aphanomyces astaci]ETV75326.1 hypothetical protein H257_10505 [Aphanomyces astaci]|eukprot:XP_009835374.1 hypothetical protein H257_10505 [Aphanomyces astaci]
MGQHQNPLVRKCRLAKNTSPPPSTMKWNRSGRNLRQPNIASMMCSPRDDSSCTTMNDSRVSSSADVGVHPTSASSVGCLRACLSCGRRWTLYVPCGVYGSDDAPRPPSLGRGTVALT